MPHPGYRADPADTIGAAGDQRGKISGEYGSLAVEIIQINIEAIRTGERPIMTQLGHVAPGELPQITGELFDRLEASVFDAHDVTFVPRDSAADDGIGWNIAHIVVHLTAGLEENAAQGSTLARGASITGRPRHETDWQTVSTREQVDARITESRRIVTGFLRTWPDQPHVDNIYEHPFFGPVNCVVHHLMGISHAQGHLAQIQDAIRQAGNAG